MVKVTGDPWITPVGGVTVGITGGVLGKGLTVMVTVATPESDLPSFALYEKKSVPLNPIFGRYEKDPFEKRITVPIVGLLYKLADKAFKLGSLSFARTPGADMFSHFPSSMEYPSLMALGGLFAPEDTSIMTVSGFPGVPSCLVL